MEYTSKQVEDIVAEVLRQVQSGEKPVADQFAFDGPCGLDPFDKDYGKLDVTATDEPSPYPRVNRILKRMRIANDHEGVDDERAKLVTDAYKKYEACPKHIKQALVLDHILRNVTIDILPDELIVGGMAAPSCCSPIFPEFSYNWIVDEALHKPWEDRRANRAFATNEVKQSLISLGEYWKGKTVEEHILCRLGEEEKKCSCLGRPVFFPNLYLYGGLGHVCARHEVVLTQGFGGIKKRIAEKMADLDLASEEGLQKREFYQAMIISLEAVTCFIKRYAQLARERANQESSGTRKQELLQIAENCEWISENPARTFWEAMQLMHITTNIIEIESNGHSISYGRMDQYLYPFYASDMKKGAVSKHFAAELIETWFFKVWELRKLRDEQTSVMNAEVGVAGPLSLYGGVDKDGKDATNDLTYLFLEGHAHTRTVDPWASLRWHANMPWELKVKVCNVIRIGTGQPKLFNDEVIIPNMLLAGKSLEDARDYGVIGCVELDSSGQSYGAHDASYFSASKVMELAINDGRCVDCGPGCINYAKCGAVGGRLGVATGSIADFKSIDDVKKAFETQMKYFVGKMMAWIHTTEIVHQELKPLPYLSAITNDCIDKGIDVTAGGARYNSSGPQIVGQATAADCFNTIEQLVFEEKKVAGAQLLDAVKKNWEGYDALRALINSDKVRHFGNDDDKADKWFRYVADVYADEVTSHPGPRGGDMHPGDYSVTANVAVGSVQGATVDGRKAGEAVSNSLNPVHTSEGTHDYKGPTAMIKSAAKMDHERYHNGTLLNCRFSPSCLEGEIGIENFINFIDTYFQRKGLHIQFNIVNKDVLRDAQKHPENYPGLLVRIAGYSAYFVRLSKELQDDLIGRNEYSAID